jgi:hypothetical protein
MKSIDPRVMLSGHTPEGGVLVGSANARHALVLFEDPQCPCGRQFEELAGLSLWPLWRLMRSPSTIACAASWDQSMREITYQTQDPQGTPAAWLNGNPLDSSAL